MPMTKLEQEQNQIIFNRVSATYGTDVAAIYMAIHDATKVYPQGEAMLGFVKQLAELIKKVKDPRVKAILQNPFAPLALENYQNLPKAKVESEQKRFKALQNFQSQLQDFIRSNASSHNSMQKANFDRLQDSMDNVIKVSEKSGVKNMFDKVAIWKKAKNTVAEDLKKVKAMFSKNYPAFQPKAVETHRPGKK